MLNPVLKLLSYVTQTVASDPLAITIGVEKADHPFGLLEGLNQPIEKNPVKTAVAEFYVILVMFVEGVHRAWSCVVRYRELKADERLCDSPAPHACSDSCCAKRKELFL